MKNMLRRALRGLRQACFFLFLWVPFLFLKIRTGISYAECWTIAKFYYSAACYRKQWLHAVRVFFLLFFRVSWRDFEPKYSLFNERQYKTEKEVRSIGRWYSISPKETGGSGIQFDSQKMKFFSIGREAIAHILKCNHFDKKVALLPIFTCFTVLDPFLQDEWEIRFYRYNKDLTIDTKYFSEVFQKERPTVCVFQPLSGMGFLPSEADLVKCAHENGCMTIVDQTQDIYNNRHNAFVDYYCGSLRKWYSFPDGAFLYSDKHSIDQCDGLKENSIYRTSMGLCMFAAHLRSIYDNPYFTYLYNFMWTFSVSYIGNTNIVTHTMSDYSRKILAQQDEESNTKRRKENFLYIYEGIQNLETVRPAFESIDRLSGVPLSVPVYVEDRRSFNKFLASRGIYTQLLWSKPPYIKKHITADEVTEYIYGHILSLPCDQRYDIEDMKQMVDAICTYEQRALDHAEKAM